MDAHGQNILVYVSGALSFVKKKKKAAFDPEKGKARKFFNAYLPKDRSYLHECVQSVLDI